MRMQELIQELDAIACFLGAVALHMVL